MTSSITPSFDEWLASYPSLQAKVDKFILSLKRRDVKGSYATARGTLSLIRAFIGGTQWTTAEEMLSYLRSLGSRLSLAQPIEISVGNIIRRILFIIREEHIRETTKTTTATNLTTTSLQTILTPAVATDYNIPLVELKATVMEGVSELIQELETLHEHISEQCLEHIHADEVILTAGYSKTVLHFLTTAGRKRRFKVIVVEGGKSTNLSGQDMARELASNAIDTTLIPDSAVFAMMARVNKVVISTATIVANGGLVAASGVFNIALAASELSVPLVCLVGLYKLSPLFKNHMSPALLSLASPEAVLSDSHGDVTWDRNYTRVVNPVFDYIPPDMVDLFVTNNGAHQPSYIYRLLVEYYDPEDYEF